MSSKDKAVPFNTRMMIAWSSEIECPNEGEATSKRTRQKCHYFQLTGQIQCWVFTLNVSTFSPAPFEPFPRFYQRQTSWPNTTVYLSGRCGTRLVSQIKSALVPGLKRPMILMSWLNVGHRKQIILAGDFWWTNTERLGGRTCSTSSHRIKTGSVQTWSKALP